MDTTKVDERMTMTAKTIMPAWMINNQNNNQNNNTNTNTNAAKATKTNVTVTNTMTTADVQCPQDEQQQQQQEEQEVVDLQSIDTKSKVMHEYDVDDLRMNDDKSNNKSNDDDDENPIIKDNDTIMMNENNNNSDLTGASATINKILIRYSNEQIIQMRNIGIVKKSAPDYLKRFHSICRIQNFMLPKFAQQAIYQQQNFLNSIQSINQQHHQQHHHQHHYNHHHHQSSKQQQNKQQQMSNNKYLEKTLNDRDSTDGSKTPPPSSTSSSLSASTSNNNNNNNDSTIVRVSLGIHDEVKLNETENAWQPSMLKRQKTGSNLTEKDYEEQTIRKFRGILNKLTPDNFDLLVVEIEKLNINTMALLNGITVVLFEKAIYDSNFAVSYGKLCKSLAKTFIIPTMAKNDATGKSNKNNNGCENENSNSTDKKKINQNVFVTALVKMCQFEFEKHFGNVKVNEQEMLKVKEQLKSGVATADGNVSNANATTTDTTDTGAGTGNNLIVKEQLIEDQHRLRRRSVCTVRFIGELYKNDILTINIMDWCIRHLLDVRSEEKLECVCRLLTTIGEKIEKDSLERKLNDKRYIELEPYFDQMQSIATPNKRSQKPQVSSRVRFMLQDVIDLKRNKWIPRRVELKQQTIEEIKNEFELN